MRRLAMVGALVIFTLALGGCEANGALVAELTFGELYCEEDWDESEVQQRDKLVGDVISFRPGASCAELGFTLHCPDSHETVFHLPEHDC